jgi:hypothetical protein
MGLCNLETTEEMREQPSGKGSFLELSFSKRTISQSKIRRRIRSVMLQKEKEGGKMTGT